MRVKAGRLASLSSILLFAPAGPATLQAQAPSAMRIDFAAPTQQDDDYRPPIMGVQTNFGMVRELGYTSGEDARAKMDELGADSYRDGIAWAAFRTLPGGKFQMRQQRRVLDFFPIGGKDPMIVLGAPAFKIAETGMPFANWQLREFATYTKRIVEMTEQYEPIYEVWNEYNLRVSYEPQPTPLKGAGDPSDIRAAVHYVPLAKVGVEAVKEANPNAKVVIGAAGYDPDWEWTKAIIRGGVLDGADGLAIHLYNKCSPIQERNAAETLDRLVQLQDWMKTQRGGTTTPIYVTEVGWSTMTPSIRCGVTLERQGHNLAQYILQSSTIPWIRGSWIYELKDKGVRPKSLEEHFGIFGHDDEEKPAVCFVKEARQIVASARSLELKRPRRDLFVLRAVLPDRQVVVSWTSAMTPKGALSFAQAPRSVRTMCGGPIEGQRAVPISPAPVIAEFGLRQPISLTISG